MFGLKTKKKGSSRVQSTKSVLLNLKYSGVRVVVTGILLFSCWFSRVMMVKG